jgi:hypothetical protein
MSFPIGGRAVCRSRHGDPVHALIPPGAEPTLPGTNRVPSETERGGIPDDETWRIGDAAPTGAYFVLPAVPLVTCDRRKGAEKAPHSGSRAHNRMLAGRWPKLFN